MDSVPIIKIEPTPEPLKIEQEEPLNKNLHSLQFIYANLSEAQKVRGRFSLVDCKNLLNAKNTLQKFFDQPYFKVELSPQKDKEEDQLSSPPVADLAIFNSLKILFAATELQQSTGIFSIEGSVELFDALQSIESSLLLVRDPQLQLNPTPAKEKSKKKNKK